MLILGVPPIISLIFAGIEILMSVKLSNTLLLVVIGPLGSTQLKLHEENEIRNNGIKTFSVRLIDFMVSVFFGYQQN